jgi:hypothetical protein
MRGHAPRSRAVSYGRCRLGLTSPNGLDLLRGHRERLWSPLCRLPAQGTVAPVRGLCAPGTVHGSPRGRAQDRRADRGAGGLPQRDSPQTSPWPRNPCWGATRRGPCGSVRRARGGGSPTIGAGMWPHLRSLKPGSLLLCAPSRLYATRSAQRSGNWSHGRAPTVRPWSGIWFGPGLSLAAVGLTAEESARATRMYLDGLTRVEIAASYGIAASTIRSCLLRRGVSTRPPSRYGVVSTTRSWPAAQATRARRRPRRGAPRGKP